MNDIKFSILGSYIIKKEKKIFLTQTENKLLYFFCNNYDTRVYSYDIVEYLQNSTDKVVYTEQNIYVHINRIRKKLEIIHPNRKF
ncbi:helix-turn-helix domain-containing protein [Paenibacillus polymyxa]|uniref:helix-turn-helix domain-containing protein n=1 Tax=Paenibacillus polymyxa TaxID=1406 RepID=UPI0037C6D8AF